VAKGGKRQPTHRYINWTGIIIHWFPFSDYLKRGQADGKGGNGDHPPLNLTKISYRMQDQFFVSKKIRKKKTVLLCSVILEIIFSLLPWVFSFVNSRSSRRRSPFSRWRNHIQNQIPNLQLLPDPHPARWSFFPPLFIIYVQSIKSIISAVRPLSITFHNL